MTAGAARKSRAIGRCSPWSVRRSPPRSTQTSAAPATATDEKKAEDGDDPKAKKEKPRPPLAQTVVERAEPRETRMRHYTIDELRALDDREPIGDERGDMLVSELRASQATPLQSPLSEGGQRAARAGGRVAEPSDAPVNGRGPNKAAAGELRLWRKKALRVVADRGRAGSPITASHPSGPSR